MENEAVIKFPKYYRLIGIFVVLFLAIAVLIKYLSLFMPFIIALLIAFLLSPFVDYLEGTGMSRTIAVVIIFIIFGLVLFVAFKMLPPILFREIDGFKQQLPAYAESAKSLSADAIKTVNKLEKENPWIKRFNLSKTIETSINKFGTSKEAGDMGKIAGFVTKILSSAMDIILFLILIPFLVFFVMRDGRLIKKTMIALVPNRYFEMALSIQYELDRQLRNYIKGQLLDTLIVGALSWIALRIVGMKYDFAIGWMAGFANLIPIIGSIIPSVIVVFVALLDANSLSLAIKGVIALQVVQLLDRAIVSPIVVGKSVSLHPVLVMFAIIAGGYVMGVFGMVAGVPLFSAVLVTIKILTTGFREYKV